MRNVGLIIASLLIIVLSGVSTYIPITDFQFTHTLDENGQIINPSVTDDAVLEKIKLGVSSEFPNPKIAEDFFKQKKLNSDTVGWLSIPSISYYPVMYSGDNQYYLNHDQNKKYHYRGAVFMNKFSEGSFSQNCLLHAHRMKDGTMFGSLNRFLDQDFFRSNKPIEVFDGEYLYYFKPFTIFYMKDGEEFVNQSKTLSDEKKEKYMLSLIERSKSKMEDGISVDFKAETIFFSTCDYSFDDARLVLGAYLIKKVPYKASGEEQVFLNSSNELQDIFLTKA